MIDFAVNQQTCTRCGQCVADCPARIITMEASGPAISAANEGACYRCQHCLAICPTGAVSILGLQAGSSRPLAGNFPDPGQLEILLKGRRSIRRYKDENLHPQLLQHLLDVAWHAPSGRNCRQLLFTVIDDKSKLAELREEIMSELGRLVEEEALPAAFAFYADFVRLWQEEGIDVIFRNAPHLLIVSSPPEVASPLPDCIIALSYFELYAQANGVGTVWNGLAKLAINDLIPSVRGRLGIPDNHLIGYAMAFGKPAVHYARTAQHGPAQINRVR